MKSLRALSAVLAAVAVLTYAACKAAPEQGKTPADAVRYFHDSIQVLRDLSLQAEDAVATDPDLTKKINEKRSKLRSLFPDPKTATILMTTFAIANIQEHSILSEKIDGSAATVRVVRTPGSLGDAPAGAAQAPGEMIFELKRQKGRWFITDIDGLITRSRNLAADAKKK